MLINIEFKYITHLSIAKLIKISESTNNYEFFLAQSSSKNVFVIPKCSQEGDLGIVNI